MMQNSTCDSKEAALSSQLCKGIEKFLRFGGEGFVPTAPCLFGLDKRWHVVNVTTVLITILLEKCQSCN